MVGISVIGQIAVSKIGGVGRWIRRTASGIIACKLDSRLDRTGVLMRLSARLKAFEVFGFCQRRLAAVAPIHLGPILLVGPMNAASPKFASSP